jgi:hypothetical protein
MSTQTAVLPERAASQDPGFDLGHQASSGASHDSTAHVTAGHDPAQNWDMARGNGEPPSISPLL